MDKLSMQTTNQVDENIKRMGELFPNCLTERLDENGKPYDGYLVYQSGVSEVEEFVKKVRK